MSISVNKVSKKVVITNNNFLLFQKYNISATLDTDIETDGLRNTLLTISQRTFCPGVQEADLQTFAGFWQPGCTYFREISQTVSTIRSVKCKIFGKGNAFCTSCSLAKRAVLRKKLRLKLSFKKDMHHNTPLGKVAHSRLVSAIKLQRKSVKKLQQELKVVKEKLKKADIPLDDSLHKALHEICEDHATKGNSFLSLFWTEQKKLFNTAKTGIALLLGKLK